MATHTKSGTDVDELTPTAEEKYAALASWWERYKDKFTAWYLNLSTDEQKSTLRKASPDMPVDCPKSRARSALSTASPSAPANLPDSTDKQEQLPKVQNETDIANETATPTFRPTDLLLPELNEESLLALQGKILLLLLSRRLQTPDLCYGSDVKLLNDQLRSGVLPPLSNGQLDHIDTPFVDPMDEQENIRSFGPDMTAETRAVFSQHFESGRLVRAEVWLCLKVIVEF